MRSRRRFHGFCPPSSRASVLNLSQTITRQPSDDYTSNLSGLVELAVQSIVTSSPPGVSCEKPIQVLDIHPMIKLCLSNLDEQQDDTSRCSVPSDDASDEERECVERDDMGIHRSHSTTREDVVISLNNDDKPSSIIDCAQSEGLLLLSKEWPPCEAVEEESEDLKSRKTEEQADLLDGSGKELTFSSFRFNYLLVTVAIMLADGLQGTHLYVLYEGYGYSVASLYCLGFFTGAVTSPITGPLVDKIGRKKAALLYCLLEIGINVLEQYPILAGLIVSRMVGGVTTNLLSSVFETWLDTEYRRRGFPQDRYELVMRDSVIVSNLAAITSGILAHNLAERFGPVGPFRGAVTCTAVALAIVAVVWTENYGATITGMDSQHNDKDDGREPEQPRRSSSVKDFMAGAIVTFRSDSKILRIGIIQGLTMGAVQIFIFLWSPALRDLARLRQHDAHEGASAPRWWWGLDSHGEPAFGLIFGAFMAAGVMGGTLSPWVRQCVTGLLTPLSRNAGGQLLGKAIDVADVEGEGKVRPMAVEFLAAVCYLLSAGLLLTPCLVSGIEEGSSNNLRSSSSFSIVLGAFLLYEFVIGVYMPCEGVIRSIYIPSDSRCSLLTVPRMIVNVAVSLGVISTNYTSLNAAFGAIAALMVISAILQLSLVSSREWSSLFGRVDRLQKRLSRSFSRRSFSLSDSSDVLDFGASGNRIVHSILEDNDEVEGISAMSSTISPQLSTTTDSLSKKNR